MHAPQFVRSLHRYSDAVSNQRINSFEPKYLATKNSAEVSRERLRHLVEIKLPPPFFLHRGHRLRGDSTGHNQVEVAEIRIHIQSESMRSYGARNVHADRRDLRLRVCVVAGLRPAIEPEAPHHTSRFCPHAGKPGQPLSRNAEIATSADQHFFQPSNIINRAKRLAR